MLFYLQAKARCSIKNEPNAMIFNPPSFDKDEQDYLSFEGEKEGVSSTIKPVTHDALVGGKQCV